MHGQGIAQLHGLIPAHAGNTPYTRTRPTSWRAHPRSRGEHQKLGHPLGKCSGSSPLTRGTRPVACGGVNFKGLIPAHAGNTVASCAISRRNRAHPRSRGEHSRRVFRLGRDEGSSPLTRGTQEGAELGKGGLGLIPAHAGNTTVSCGFGGLWRAHPRSRGEHLRMLLTKQTW